MKWKSHTRTKRTTTRSVGRNLAYAGTSRTHDQDPTQNRAACRLAPLIFRDFPARRLHPSKYSPALPLPIFQRTRARGTLAKVIVADQRESIATSIRKRRTRTCACRRYS